jgi:hypothetical protein
LDLGRDVVDNSSNVDLSIVPLSSDLQVLSTKLSEIMSERYEYTPVYRKDTPEYVCNSVALDL